MPGFVRSSVPEDDASAFGRAYARSAAKRLTMAIFHPTSHKASSLFPEQLLLAETMNIPHALPEQWLLWTATTRLPCAIVLA
jgi:hypothetical protein